jgi:hypothetical protein
MNLRRSLSFIFAGALASVASSMPAAAANSTPAIAAFDTAFAGINDYECQIKAHEVKGTQTQDRVYQYYFMKPNYAKTLILSGDGQGSGGVWAGGDQVSGHQGGFLSGIHLKVSVHDPRATSLLGFTIPDGLLQNIVATIASTPGTISQTAGGKIDGALTDRVDLKIANPAPPNNISEMVIYFSRDTHFPVREISYQGSTIVVDQSVTNFKTNAGLTQADFPF